MAYLNNIRAWFWFFVCGFNFHSWKEVERNWDRGYIVVECRRCECCQVRS